MDLTAAVDLVCADLRTALIHGGVMTAAELVEHAVDEVTDDEIAQALAGGEIDGETATAYEAVWQADPHELTAVIGDT